MKNRHDKLFKFTFSRPEQIRDLLLYYVDEKFREGWDLSTIEVSKDSFVDNKLKEFFSDIVFTCRTDTNESMTICFILEHKSYVDKLLPFQLLRYLVEVYDRQNSKQNKGKNSEPIDPVIPIVLYHGSEPWVKELLHERIKLPKPELSG